MRALYGTNPYKSEDGQPRCMQTMSVLRLLAETVKPGTLLSLMLELTLLSAVM